VCVCFREGEEGEEGEEGDQVVAGSLRAGQATVTACCCEPALRQHAAPQPNVAIGHIASLPIMPITENM